MWVYGFIDLLVGGDGLRRPSGCCKGYDEYGDEAEDGCRDEQAKHPVGCDPGDFERIGDFCGEGDYTIFVISTVQRAGLRDVLVAPARSWFRIIDTGSNQYKACGSLQLVIPVSS